MRLPTTGLGTKSSQCGHDEQDRQQTQHDRRKCDADAFPHPALNLLTAISNHVPQNVPFRWFHVFNSSFAIGNAGRRLLSLIK